MKSIITKSIVAVSTYFTKLGVGIALTIVALYALVNTLLFLNNKTLGDIDYFPFSFFYDSAWKLLNFAAPALGVIFISAIALSVSLEYAISKYKNGSVDRG